MHYMDYYYLYQLNQTDPQIIEWTCRHGCHQECGCRWSRFDPAGLRSGPTHVEQKGAFGSVLVVKLLEAGYNVTVLTRSRASLQD